MNRPSKNRAEGRTGRHSTPHQLVPNTPLGWVLAAVSVLMIGVGAHAAAEPVRGFYRQGLPGTVEPGSKKTDRERSDQNQDAQEDAVSTKLFRQALPGHEGFAHATYVNQTVNRDGASVILEWAHANTDSVVLGFGVRDLEENRRYAGNLATLEPIFVSEQEEDVPSAPDRRSKLTDEAGRYFGSIDGTSMVAGAGAGPRPIRAPKAQTAVFESPGGWTQAASTVFGSTCSWRRCRSPVDGRGGERHKERREQAAHRTAG